jgi:hypothetical protein
LSAHGEQLMMSTVRALPPWDKDRQQGARRGARTAAAS